MRHLLAFAFFASMLPLSSAYGQSFVQSQEGIALENQILQLQQQVQALQAQPGGGGNSALGGAPPPVAGAAPGDASVVTSLLTQVQQLQAQVQTLNGEVDTLQNQVNTQHDATEKEIGDLKFAITNGAAPGAAPATPPAAPGAAAAPGPAVPSLGTLPAGKAPAALTTPAATLRAGQAALARGDYPAAEAAARNVLATDRTSPQGYQAQYLLAQSLYDQGRPQDAAIAYDDTYNRDRAGSNAAGALLGLANSLTAIHQQAAACDTLASLNSQFPTPAPGLAARIAAAGRRAQCR